MPAPRSWLIGAVMLVATVVGVVLAGRAFLTADDLVEYERAEAEYARLVALAAEACRTGPCAFGWSSPQEVPPDIRTLMARVRGRDVVHDSLAARTTLRGGYGARFSLEHDTPPNPRAAQARHEPIEGWMGPPPLVQDLGGGWTRVQRR